MKKKGLRPISNQSNIKRWNWNNSFLKKKNLKQSQSALTFEINTSSSKLGINPIATKKNLS
jgi:hypothetical protein